MHDYEKEPLPEAWAWETPVSGGTWATHVRAGWGKPSPDATKFNLRPLYTADALASADKQIFRSDEEAVAWMVEDGTIVREDFAAKLGWTGSIVGTGRAIPNCWTPMLYAKSVKASNV